MNDTTATDADLFGPDGSTTERDWIARAWEHIRRNRPRYAALGLDEALAQPILGRILRAYAAQLQRDHAAAQARAAREARYGRRMEWTGFGYRPARVGGRGRA